MLLMGYSNLVPLCQSRFNLTICTSLCVAMSSTSRESVGSAPKQLLLAFFFLFFLLCLFAGSTDLLILYIHDMWCGLENMLVLYADDVTILTHIPSPNIRSDVTESLNRDLSKISTWCNLWT